MVDSSGKNFTGYFIWSMSKCQSHNKNVSHEQEKIVQDRLTYFIILSQSFIAATRMKTKVMTNKSAYAWIINRNENVIDGVYAL